MDRDKVYAKDAIIRELVRRSLMETGVYGTQSPQHMTAVPSIWQENRSPAAVYNSPPTNSLATDPLQRLFGAGQYFDDQQRANGMYGEQKRLKER